MVDDVKKQPKQGSVEGRIGSRIILRCSSVSSTPKPAQIPTPTNNTTAFKPIRQILTYLNVVSSIQKSSKMSDELLECDRCSRCHYCYGYITCCNLCSCVNYSIKRTNSDLARSVRRCPSSRGGEKNHFDSSANSQTLRDFEPDKLSANQVKIDSTVLANRFCGVSGSCNEIFFDADNRCNCDGAPSMNRKDLNISPLYQVNGWQRQLSAGSIQENGEDVVGKEIKAFFSSKCIRNGLNKFAERMFSASNDSIQIEMVNKNNDSSLRQGCTNYACCLSNNLRRNNSIDKSEFIDTVGDCDRHASVGGDRRTSSSIHAAKIKTDRREFENGKHSSLSTVGSSNSSCSSINIVAAKKYTRPSSSIIMMNRSFPNLTLENVQFCGNGKQWRSNSTVGDNAIDKNHERTKTAIVGPVKPSSPIWNSPAEKIYKHGEIVARRKVPPPPPPHQTSSVQFRRSYNVETNDCFETLVNKRNCHLPSYACEMLPRIQRSRGSPQFENVCTPIRHSTPTGASVRTINSGVNANLRIQNANEEITKISPNHSRNTNLNSKKMMVAPQPQYSDRLDSYLREDSINGRQVPDADIFPMAHSITHRGDICSQENPLNFHKFESYTDRAKNNSELRVGMLEKRVQELEAAIINGHSSPSTSIGAPYVVPCMNKSSRMSHSSSQFAISERSSESNQLVLEIHGKEREIKRLQEQLKKSVAKIELLKVHYDDEAMVFHKESEEAKSQLKKVKSRLNELENECRLYREKAIATDEARNSTISSCVEKIASQEKELNALHDKLEKSVSLQKELDIVKGSLNQCESENGVLRDDVNLKEAAIRDLKTVLSVLKLRGAPCMHESSSDDLFSKSSMNDEIQQILTSSASSIQKQLMVSQECRILAKCLLNMASRVKNGDIPSVNQLLGFRSDSMSETECDDSAAECNSLETDSIEESIKKIAENLNCIERHLNGLREKFVEYCHSKMMEELYDEDACRLQ